MKAAIGTLDGQFFHNGALSVILLLNSAAPRERQTSCTFYMYGAFRLGPASTRGRSLKSLTRSSAFGETATPGNFVFRYGKQNGGTRVPPRNRTHASMVYSGQPYSLAVSNMFLYISNSPLTYAISTMVWTSASV